MTSVSYYIWPLCSLTCICIWLTYSVFIMHFNTVHSLFLQFKPLMSSCILQYTVGIGRTDREQIRSRINNNDCNHCYWFCYVFAHDQFARYQQSSNEPLRYHTVGTCVYVATFTTWKGMVTAEKKRDPAPKLVAYPITQSFSHASHRVQAPSHCSFSPVTIPFQAVKVAIMYTQVHTSLQTHTDNTSTLLTYVHVQT